MSIPVSENPVLKGNAVTITVPGNYQELLFCLVDPDVSGLYIDSLQIDISDVTTQPFINVSLNGISYLEDFPLINTSVKFGFGSHWKISKHDVAIQVQIKTTALSTVAGTPALRASAYVSGVQHV